MMRPTLACSLDTEQDIEDLFLIHNEIWLSEKKDGIRGIKSSNRLWSREAKLIPNRRLQRALSDVPNGLDGEIMFIIDGQDGVHPPLEHINSIVTSDNAQWPKRWTPMFYAFDFQVMHRMYYWARYMEMVARWADHPDKPYRVITQQPVYSAKKVIQLFNKVVNAGGEGICLRSPNTKYKEGRSTFNDACLLRFKKLMRERATIWGFTPLERHVGPQKRNAFGLAKRDGKKGNLEQVEELGALLGVHETLGRFKVGSGFTADQRRKYYLKGEKLVGREFLFEYRDTTHKGVPRNPTFIELL